MSILLIGDPGSVGEILVRRLIAQGDEVRAIATDADSGDLSGHGVHIARGPDLDADLVERAAQNVRTLISFDPSNEVMEPVVEGARAARVERVIVCAAAVSPSARERLRTSELDYVVLEAPRRGRLRKGLSDEELAEAIDAADDVAGPLRVELDLLEAASWKPLKLTAPAGIR
jgi:nucleoside-diphosphate-sugar epimerase